MQEFDSKVNLGCRRPGNSVAEGHVLPVLVSNARAGYLMTSRVLPYFQIGSGGKRLVPDYAQIR